MRQRTLLKPLSILVLAVVGAVCLLGSIVLIPSWVDAQKKPAKQPVQRTVVVNTGADSTIVVHDHYSFTANVATWNSIIIVLDSATTHIDTRYSAEYVQGLQTAIQRIKDTLLRQVSKQYIADSAYWRLIQGKH